MNEFIDINHLKDLQFQAGGGGGRSSVIVCTDLSDKEPHRQSGTDRVIVSGRLNSLMVSMLATEWQEVRVRILFTPNISHFQYPYDNISLEIINKFEHIFI